MNDVLRRTHVRPWKVKLALSVFDLEIPADATSSFLCAFHLSQSTISKESPSWCPAAVTEIQEANDCVFFEGEFQVYYRFQDITPLRFVLYEIAAQNEDEFQMGKMPAEQEELSGSTYEHQRIAFQPRPLPIPAHAKVYGEVICDLVDLITAKNNYLQIPMMHHGTQKGMMSIHASDSSYDRYALSLQFRARNLPSSAAFTKQNSILRILCNTGATNGWEVVGSTKAVDSNNPIWGLMKLTLRQLCDGEPEAKCIRLEIEVGGEVVGSRLSSVGELLERENFTLPYIGLPTKSMELQLIHYNLQLRPSFLDLLQNGMQTHLISAIDITASNKNPSEPESHHYLSDEPNQYESILRKMGRIVSRYSPKPTYRAYSFGGIPAEEQEVSHCYPLYKEDKKWASTVEELLRVYKTAVRTSHMSGPTVFSEIIHEAMKIGQQAQANFKKVGDNQYFLLLITTDGMVMDWRDTVDALIALARLPMSVIIFGIGDADLTQMMSLHQKLLISSAGIPLSRLNIQFVSSASSEKEDCPQSIAECLGKIPFQIAEYMQVEKLPVLQTLTNLAHSSDDIMCRASSPVTFERTEPPEYLPDQDIKECPLCDAGFGLLTRKHHCKGCGAVVCSSCSSNYAPIPQYDLPSPQKVCDLCFALLLRSRDQ